MIRSVNQEKVGVGTRWLMLPVGPVNQGVLMIQFCHGGEAGTIDWARSVVTVEALRT